MGSGRSRFRENEMSLGRFAFRLTGTGGARVRDGSVVAVRFVGCVVESPGLDVRRYFRGPAFLRDLREVIMIPDKGLVAEFGLDVSEGVADDVTWEIAPAPRATVRFAGGGGFDVTFQVRCRCAGRGAYPWTEVAAHMAASLTWHFLHGNVPADCSDGCVTIRNVELGVRRF